MVKKFKVRVNGKEYIVEVEDLQAHTQILQEKTPSNVENVKTPTVEEKTQSKPETEKIEPKKSSSGSHTINAPMSGLVLKVLISQGQNVKPGDKVVILEAMKMENEIIAEVGGTVKNVLVKEGDNVDTGQALIELE
ncbi:MULTISPECIES: biotin/lipoyl-containing protein [unclassified Thermosipho (in: thermotogales)]|uniref:biotin/lipoyl-containing protein n=1 Tax=unclassified Thermosipho (in: thermotogales) TaxID=2676525 RepID=UPI000986C196|nr:MULTISPECIES: biotin/lipoyl-containing protein [unclassified Thermosipho (in: thermotogales)]MBT1248184.1 acetyl-CoA carboxylase biotin carboxyl carrier protein subunit [Thermosipho sp. 1244]OOC46443.1 propionyl-CoA carboxylase [Thermosipho sp. 1223]